MLRTTKTFKLENVKVVFENESQEYYIRADEQTLTLPIPGSWEYDVVLNCRIEVWCVRVEGILRLKERWCVAIQRGWFRNKVVLVADERNRIIASRPLPVVGIEGYNSNVFYFIALPLIILFAFWLLWKKFYRRRK